MLNRHEHRVDAKVIGVRIIERDLALHIRTGVGEFPFLTKSSRRANQFMGNGNGQRHVSIGFVGRVAKHNSLVSGALFQNVSAVHALLNVARLPLHTIFNDAGITSDTEFWLGVADFAKGVADDFFAVDVLPASTGDFSAD